MYNIEKTNYGFKLTFGDFIQAPEMKEWVEKSKEALADAPAEFYIFVDMRTLKPLPENAQPFMQEGQKLYKEKGMKRSVVILNNSVTTLQFKRIAKETGIDAWERYIDASANENWETDGIAWLVNEKDPDA